MTVGSNLAGGWQLIRTHPLAVIVWGLLYAVVNLSALIFIQPVMAQLVRAQNGAQAAGAAPFTGADMTNIVGPMFLFYLVMIVAFLAMFNAAVRATSRTDNDPFGFLRLGMDELRVFGVNVVLWLLFMVVYIVAAVVMSLVAGMVWATASPNVGITIGIIGSLMCLGLVMWGYIRMSLAGAMTVLRGEIVLRDAWRATRGHFWTLFGTYFVGFLLVLLVGGTIFAVTNPGLLSAYTSMNPLALQAASQAQLAEAAGGLSVLMIAKTVAGALVYAALFAFIFGAMATAARALVESDGKDAHLEEVFA